MKLGHGDDAARARRSVGSGGGRASKMNKKKRIAAKSTSYRNFWAMNVDEAIVAGDLQREFRGRAEVFFPLNAQLEGVDLLLVNLKYKKTVSFQVKGSKAFIPKSRGDKRKFENNSVGWFKIPKKKIMKSRADFFIFLCHVFAPDAIKGRNVFNTHMITVPSRRLRTICKAKSSGTFTHFYMVVAPEETVWDCRDKKRIYFTDFLDAKGLVPIWKKLKLRR